MTRPYLIILDEPCAGIDPGAREKFLASLRRIRSHKRIPALIYVTHHIEEILPLFGKTLVLREGKVLYAGRTNQVLKARMLEELYGASFSLVRRKRALISLHVPSRDLSPSLRNAHNQSREELFDGSKGIQDRETVGPRNHARTASGASRRSTAA